MTTPIAAATIPQQAFRYIGASTPSSFGDDSDEARAATEQFPVALSECLELRDWRFASKLIRPPLADPTSTDPGWTVDADLPFAYRLPAGVLVARAIQPRTARWRRDGDYIRCDVGADVTLRATMLRTDEKNLPATFRDLVALTLALQLAPRFARDANRIAMIGDQREAALGAAIAADHGQASPGPWLGAGLASSVIVQQAFRYVIGSEAGGFGDDSEEARAAAQLHPLALDQCLAEEDWPFASATIQVAADAAPAATVAGWRDDAALPFAYKLPDDALAPRAIRPRGARWRREGPFLRCDKAGGIDLRFTRRITAEDDLPAAFRDYVALTLAQLLAPRFAAKAEVAQLLAEKLAAARTFAIKTEGVQRSAGPFLSETLEGSEIAQQAWRLIEAGEEARPDDDGEKARATDQLYRRAVRACLGAADWSFASKLRTLTEIEDPGAADPFWTADEDRPHAYAIPAGALTIREVRPAGVAWRKSGQLILADEAASLVARFTMAPVATDDLTEDAATVAAEADWPAEFVAFAALTLAHHLAPRFASEKLAQQLMARADIAKRALLKVDRDQASAEEWGDYGAGDWVAQVMR